MEKREYQNSEIGLGLKVMIVLCMVFTVYNSYLTIESRKDVIAMKEALKDIQATVAEPIVVTNTKTIIKEEKKAETKQTQKSESEPVQKTDATKPAVETKQPASTTTETPKVAKKVRITPTAKVRIENRYVLGTTYLPEGKFTQGGIIKVWVYVDFLGKVAKTEIAESDITDEDVLYVCREAALKTRFSHDSHADLNSLLRGTITYTFSTQ